jgi:diguanylate cyclase (GGDEF)-like protein
VSTERPSAAPAAVGSATEVVVVALRRMRLIVAVLLFMQFATYRPGPDDPRLPLPALLFAALLAGTAAAISLISWYGERGGERRRSVFATIEIAADAALVISLATVLDLTGRNVLWVLLVIPVLEGALRYRLRGAMIVWGLMAVAYVGVTLLTSGADGDQFLVDVEQAVQQLGVVLLITVPAGFLSEQLVLDIRKQQTAREQAVQRGNLLEAVAEAGHRVTSLEVEAVQAVTRAALDLGFDRVDLGVRRGDDWFAAGAQPVEGPGLPPPDGLAGGALQAAEARHSVVIDGESDVAEELAGLSAVGLTAVIACPLHAFGGQVVLRAGLEPGSAVTGAQYDCLELLAAQAGVALRNNELVAQQRAMQEQLEHRAFHDGLTGLPNRSRFLQLLEESLARPAPAEEQAAILFVDLDRFKPVNDSLGHDAGNELLIAVGNRLSGAVKKGDVVARLGGDEFVILLEAVPHLDTATEVADRVCRALSEPFRVAEHEVVISGSVGVAMTARPYDNAAELIRRADQAMYRAKGSGRARYAVYEPGIDTGSVARLQLEADLRAALHGEGLRLVYQPVVSAYDQQIVAVEALVRWQHPVHGAISPSSLIPIAEDSGLIVDLGRWVLQTACRALRAWEGAPGATSLAMAVNVSPSQLTHLGFARDFDRVLSETGVHPSRLLLEVTENVVALGPDLFALLHDLRSRGVRLALDDFGQGQTSLRYLRDLPLDVLKIDKAFVDGLGNGNDDDEAIVTAIVGLAHKLGIRVIAEGVEREVQLQALRAINTDFVQGYLLHRPKEADEMAALLGVTPGVRVGA